MREMLLKSLVFVLALGFGGATFAAAQSPVKSQIVVAYGDTPSQTQAPPDCKKNPTDPRCKEKKDNQG